MISSRSVPADPSVVPAKSPPWAHFPRFLRRRAMLHRIARYVSKPAIYAGIGALRVSPKNEVPRCFQRLGPYPGAGPMDVPKVQDVAGEDPIISGMAGRYALALFELARDAGAIDAVKSDLDRFEALIAESPDLERLIRSPVFSAEEQLKALSSVLDKVGIHGLVANFLKLVT